MLNNQMVHVYWTSQKGNKPLEIVDQNEGRWTQVQHHSSKNHIIRKPSAKM